MHTSSPAHRLPRTPAPLHVAGIGGVGMNAIAQVLHARGHRVTGSDRMADQGTTTPVLRKLRAAGIHIVPQDGTGVTDETTALVISSAIENDNPDLLAAKARGIPVLHRATALAAAIGDQSCIAIAGTSGKTTVTGMVGWLLTELGLQPNVVNGGALLNWQDEDTIGNVRMTGSDWWVVEVDESDRSLLRFTPEWALLTNISRDHFDLAETCALFDDFCTRVRTGLVIDAASARQLPRTQQGETRIVKWTPEAAAPLSIPLPGEHNRLNAELALTFCEAFGYDRAEALRCLQSFHGLERRLQRVSAGDAVAVYDDYAHNPAKIAAAWQAARQAGGRVRGVWRPHGYRPLAAMADELCDMFTQMVRRRDQLLVLPVYYAGGTTNADYHSESFVDQLNEHGVMARYVADYRETEALFLKDVQPTDTFLCMGARDPELPVFARHLADRLRTAQG